MRTIIIVCSVLCITTFLLFLLFLSDPIRNKENFKKNLTLLKINQNKIVITGLITILLLALSNIFYISSNQTSQKNTSNSSTTSTIKDSSTTSTVKKAKSSETFDSESSSTATSSAELKNSSSLSSVETSESQVDGKNSGNGITISEYFESDDNGKAVVSGVAPSNAKKIYVQNAYDDSNLTAEVKSDGTFSFEYQLQSADSEITLFLIVESEKDKIPFDQWVMTDVIPSTNYERKIEDASKDKEAQELDEYNKKQQEKLADSVDYTEN